MFIFPLHLDVKEEPPDSVEDHALLFDERATRNLEEEVSQVNCVPCSTFCDSCLYSVTQFFFYCCRSYMGKVDTWMLILRTQSWKKTQGYVIFSMLVTMQNFHQH